MDYRTREKIIINSVFRNAPDRIRMQLLNGGRSLTPAEQAKLKAESTGPLTMPRLPQNSRRK